MLKINRGEQVMSGKTTTPAKQKRQRPERKIERAIRLPQQGEAGVKKMKLTSDSIYGLKSAILRHVEQKLRTELFRGVEYDDWDKLYPNQHTTLRIELNVSIDHCGKFEVSEL